MMKQEIIYNGESVKIFGTENPELVEVCFTDNITAFNKIKRAVIADKGALNAAISAMIFGLVEKGGVRTHFIKRISPTEQLCRRVDNIMIEVIVRNVIAGSMAHRLGLAEGLRPAETVIDLCYKNEDLCDPVINDCHAVALGLVSRAELDEIYSATRRINEILRPVFASVGIELVDYKIEFGRLPDGEIILADEINPDNARFWDAETGERYDKDRFRRDMGRVGDAYRMVYTRLLSVCFPDGAPDGYPEPLSDELAETLKNNNA